MIAAIVAAVVFGIQLQRTASIDAYRIAIRNLSFGMARQTTKWLGAVDRALTELPADLVAGPGRSGQPLRDVLRSRAAFDVLSDRQKRLTGISALMVIDADGKTVNSSRMWPAAPVDVAESEVFRDLKSRDDHQAVASAPMQDPITGAWFSLLARRFNDGGGHFAGLVVAEMSLAELEDFYRTAMPPRRTVTVARRDGVVLVQFPHPEDHTGWRIPATAQWHTVLAQGGGEYYGPSYFGNATVVSSVTPLPKLPVVVEAIVPEPEVLADWYRTRLWIAGSGVASAVAVLLLLRLLAGQFLRLERSEMSLAAKNAQLEVAHLQFDMALSNMSQGLTLFDGNRRLVVSNTRFAEVYGLHPDAIRPGMALAELAELWRAAGSTPDRPHEDFLRGLDSMVTSREPSEAVVEMRNGRVLSIQRQPMPDGGWLSTHEDITARRAAEAKIAFLAHHDALTGLANRLLFQDRIEMAITAAQRGTCSAVLYLDLDRFKSVNDTLGHQVGDGLLRGVAACLRGCVRDTDTVARLGGDEFVVLQWGIRLPEDAAILATRILEAFRIPHAIAGHEVVAATSIGIAILDEQSTSVDAAIKNADLALYIAKQAGRGTFRFFEPQMDARAQARYVLERDLRSALAEGQFTLHYQPQVNLHSGRTVGFEALVRWQHPGRGMVAPGDFIAVAEEAGLIVPLGEWVLQEACRVAATWPDDIHVAVNLSPAQFRKGGILQTIREALDASGLPAQRLELEITESLLLRNDNATLAALHQIRDLGISIAMDDFGVGYSSLSYLRSFPFSKVKLDRSFINDLTKRQDALFIVRAIVGLCRDLGIRTTIEGVETIEQLAVLLDEGCTEVQGYLLGRPKPADHVAGVLACPSLMPAALRTRRDVRAEAALKIVTG